MKKCDDCIKRSPSKVTLYCATCNEVNQNYRPTFIVESRVERFHLVSVEEPVVNINLTKLKRLRINEVVGLCIKLLLKRTFKTDFPVFEEAFVKDLRKAIWEVLDLHAGHLKGGVNEF